MTKKNLIALADAIRNHDYRVYKLGGQEQQQFTKMQLDALADALAAMNPNFNREVWLDYVAGTRGPNGAAR